MKKKILISFKDFKSNFGLVEIIFLLSIFLLGWFLRTYHLGNFNSFFHDQGRDALVVKRIIVDHKFTLLGPQTTAPGVYLGPFYYYLMIIPLWLTGLNPVGMDYMVALIGVGAIFILYLLNKEMFGREIALFTSLLYSTNSLVISFSNYAWNPNPLPFFMLLTIYGIYQVFERKKEKYWLVMAVGLSCALQIHLFSISLIPLIVISWLLKRHKIVNFKLFTVNCLLFTVILFPWFLFEIRHNFMDTQNLFHFLIGGKVGFNFGSFLSRINDLYFWLVSLILNNFIVSLIFSFLIISFLVKDFKNFTSKLLLSWLLIGLLLIGFYRGIFQYYHGLFLTPLPFLLFGMFLNKIWAHKILRLLGITLSFYLVFINLNNFSFKKNESKLAILKTVASIIAHDSGQKKFNLAGLTWRFDHNAMDYRYFVELKGKKALGPEDYANAEVLYVINEGQKEDLLCSKIMEISDFKPKFIVKKWKIDNKVEIYKLSK